VADEADEDSDHEGGDGSGDGGDGGEWACVAQTLDAVLALRQLKRAFPQASDSACRAALAVQASFAAAAVALYREAVMLSLPSRALLSRRPDARQPPRGNKTRYARVEDLFQKPLTTELMRTHEMSAALWAQQVRVMDGGGPQPEWRCRFFRVQRAKPEVYAILRDVAAAGAKGVNGGDGDEDVVLLRWFELPSALQHSHCGTWNLLWTWRPPRVNHTELLPWQRVNHFPQSRQLTRKDLLKKNLHRRNAVVSGRLAEACDILPLTFILPKEYVAFCDAFARCAEAEGEANVWIMKPVGLSRGRGISMLNDISGVSYGEAMVIQRYVNRPLLLDGYKFDLRLYVLVTSFAPLEAFLYSEGFGRFSTQLYSLDPSRLHDRFVHLTNASIQKEREDDAQHNPHVDSEGGTKCSLAAVRQKLAAAGVDVSLLWGRIVELVLCSLDAVHDCFPPQPTCFELFGYDVLIDEHLKPWLIEVNASPSLARDNPLDCVVKEALIADTLALVAPPYFDRVLWHEMLRWRLSAAGGERVRATPAFAAELSALLHGEEHRAYGQAPRRLGGYERIAPGPAWDRVCRRRKEK